MPPAWTLLIEPLSHLLDKIIPDPEARARAQAELVKSERETDLQELQLAVQADQAQAATNTAEAAREQLFISGWRPFIGWVCGLAFAYHFIVQPFLSFVIVNLGGKVALPGFDMNTLSTVLMGMLGLGSLRTVEKIQGATKN